jgi:hypothetical protein
MLLKTPVKRLHRLSLTNAVRSFGQPGQRPSFALEEFAGGDQKLGFVRSTLGKELYKKFTALFRTKNRISPFWQDFD